MYALQMRAVYVANTHVYVASTRGLCCKCKSSKLQTLCFKCFKYTNRHVQKCSTGAVPAGAFHPEKEAFYFLNAQYSDFCRFNTQNRRAVPTGAFFSQK